MIKEENTVEQAPDAKEAIVDNDEPFFTVSIPQLAPVVIKVEEDGENKDDISEENNTDNSTNDDENTEEEVKTKTKWRDKRKNQSEVYQKLNELVAAKEKLESENDYLKGAVSQVLEYGRGNYENNIDLTISQLEEKKLAMLRGGARAEDYAQVEKDLLGAMIAKHDATKARQDADYHKQQNEQQRERQAVDEQVDPQQIMHQQWFSYNPQLKKSSPFYNKEIADEVVALMRHADKELIESGNEEWIGTAEYLNDLQPQIDRIKANVKGNSQPKQTYSTKHIGAVRGVSVNTPVKESVNLTQDQKELAALYKIPEAEYLRRYNLAERERLGQK